MSKERKNAKRKRRPGPSGRRATIRLLGYARPYRRRFILASLGLGTASLLGLFSLLLLKPVVELLSGEQHGQRVIKQTVTKPGGESLIVDLRDDGRPPDAVEHDGLYSGWLPGDGGTSSVLTARRPRRPALSFGGVKQARSGSPLGPIERFWDNLTAPITRPLVTANQWFRRYSRENPAAGLILISLLLVGFAALRGVLEFVCHYHLAMGCYGMVADVREALFRRVIAQDYLYFAKRSTGYLESRIQSDVASIRLGAEILMRNGFQAPFQLFFLAILLLSLHFQLTLIALAVALIVMVPLIYMAKIVKKVTRQARRQADRLASGLEESLRNYPLVKFFQSEEFEGEKFHERNRHLLKYLLKNRLAQFGSKPLTQFATAAGRSAVLIAGGLMIFGGTMEFSTLTVYLVALTRFFGPSRAMSRSVTTWPGIVVSAERINEILEMKPAVIEATDAVPLEQVRTAVEFKNVSFSYENQDAVEDVSFRVPVDRTVALVGQSGAGKSTIVCLLARLFDPTGGVVEIDGVDIRRYRLADLRRIIATVTQDTILFNDTVARNIAYPDAEPDIDRAREAALAANAHDFIRNLDGGLEYDTVLGQGGQRLSGGQRQRIAIARAFYRDPEVLVFDEATSSLDEETQGLVQAAVRKLFSGRTVFIIAHRLSTVRQADEILVLHKGRLVEQGHHGELVRLGGIYASLYQISREGDLIDAVETKENEV